MSERGWQPSKLLLDMGKESSSRRAGRTKEPASTEGGRAAGRKNGRFLRATFLTSPSFLPSRRQAGIGLIDASGQSFDPNELPMRSAFRRYAVKYLITPLPSRSASRLF